MNKLICATTIKEWMKFFKNEQNTKIDGVCLAQLF